MEKNDLFYEKLESFDAHYIADEEEYEEDEWQDDETLGEYMARCPWKFAG